MTIDASTVRFRRVAGTARAAEIGVATDASGQRLGTGTGARPVLLATLDVPFDEEAAAVAVDAAVETGQPLIVANCVRLPPLVLSVMLGYDQLDDPDLAASIKRPVDLAVALGVEVEWLRVRSFHPVDALLALIAERAPGLLVFGPDRRRLRRRAYRAAARALSRRASCLVWLGS